ncbi:DMT family transporter [Actibacterium sp. D379-3]
MEHTKVSAAIQAPLWMAGAITAFTTMAIAGRAARVELDTFELMLYRSLVGLVAVLAAGAVAGTLRQITTQRMGLHLIRNISHFAGQNLWFFALTMIPLAQLFALEFSSPLWVTLLAPLVLGERITGARALAAGLGFLGVLVITHPGPASLNPGTIAAALAAIGFAGSILFTKRLTEGATITCILFWLTLIQAGLGLGTAALDGTITLPSAATLPWVLLVGCAGLTAHFCLTRALSVAPAIIVVPMDFVRLPVIAVIGMLFYDEPLEWAVAAGAVLIFGANLVNIRAGTR